MKVIKYIFGDGRVQLGLISRKDGEYVSIIRKLIEQGVAEEQAISFAANTAIKNLKAKKGYENAEITWKLIDSSNLPDGKSDGTFDSTFQEAFIDRDGKVDIDINKARDIHMNRIRFFRDIKLRELDIETLKGKDVQLEKQKLRDIPQKFDLKKAETVEELKRLWPKELENVKVR
jgi:hypothetical protein